MKLSPVQQKVIDLMKQGWEMGVSMTMDSRVWLQEDGVGRGGKSQKVNANTFFSLCSKGLIELKAQSFPTSKYGLTEKGIAL